MLATLLVSSFALACDGLAPASSLRVQRRLQPLLASTTPASASASASARLQPLLASTTPASASASSSSSSSLARRVEEALECAADKTVMPMALVSPDIAFEADMARDGGNIRGAESYARSTRRWSRNLNKLLPNATTTITRCSSMGTLGGGRGGFETIDVNWRVAWSPESLAGIVGFAEQAGWVIERFEPPSDVQSTFSAKRLLALLFKAVTTRSIRLPEAAIVGRASYRFDMSKGEGGLCVLHEETIPLVVSRHR